MKKLLSILSLGVLLFSSLAPSFTYAVDIDEVSSLLESFLQSTNNEQQENNDNIFQQSSNTDLQTLGEEETGNDEIEIIGDNNHIIWNKTKGIITVYTGDYSYGVTIQDKNLGAENVGDFGDYYLWGSGLKWEYVQGDYNPYRTLSGNARGGEYDYSDPNRNPEPNMDGRQGPCNNEFHVPSAGEFRKLLQIFENIEDNKALFSNYTKIPLGGEYYYLGDNYNRDPGRGHYWTSSASAGFRNQVESNILNSLNAYEIELRDNGDYYLNNTISANFESIRCFKNEYIPYSLKVKFNPNGGAFSGMEINQTKEYTYAADENGIIPIYNIQIPDRQSDDISQQSGWMFAGWYTKSGENNIWGEEFNINNPNSTIAYAKWLPFNELKLKLGGVNISIMDRNLGAKEKAEGKYYGYNMYNDNCVGTEGIEKIGHFYQWGNNYGFGNNLCGSTFAPMKIYELRKNNDQPRGPGNYYYDNTWISKEPYRWDENNNINLWGGNNWKNSDIEKKGPCPSGYHVPDMYEWEFAYNAFIRELENNPELCVGKNKGSCFAGIFMLPMAGFSAAGGMVRSQGNQGNYRSSTPLSGSNKISYYLNFNDNNINTKTTSNRRGEGQSVRCFKDINNSEYLNIQLNNGEQDKIYEVKKWYPIKEYLINPIENKGYIFDGWYNDENKKIVDEDLIMNAKNITAKWNKNPWYSFNANGGNFTDGKDLFISKSELTGTNNIKYSHTNNINDEGVNNGSYINEVYNKTGVIVLNGADKIGLTIKYFGNIGPLGKDFLMVWTGQHNNYNEENSGSTILNLSGYNDSKFNQYLISGDSITFLFKSFNDNRNGPGYGYYIKAEGYNYSLNDQIGEPRKTGHDFLGWYEENSETPFDIENTPVTEDKTLYAHWKSLEEKTEETTENVAYTNTTTVTVGDETTEEILSGSSILTLVTKEIEDNEVKKEEDATKVQDSEIKVTSDKTVEYEGGLEVYLEKIENAGTENETTGKVEGTIKFSAPVAVKIPISSDAEYVKVQVKHGDEAFGYKGLTFNPVNECSNGEAVNDKYNGEDVLVTGNINKYATIYTCSASTFVAYTENKKPVEPTPAAGGGRKITTTKQESNTVTEQEHNSADIIEPEVTQTSKLSANTPVIEDQVKKIEGRSLTRGEVAIMTNILLEVYPQLVEGRAELDDVTNACTNYADEQNFTKDEKKAITRLCKLSIMGIHNDTNKPLEEFLVNSKSTNDEFSKVINRSIETYNEKDLSTIKDALKKLEGDEENVVFGTVYDVFMSIKSIFN